MFRMRDKGCLSNSPNFPQSIAGPLKDNVPARAGGRGSAILLADKRVNVSASTLPPAPGSLDSGHIHTELIADGDATAGPAYTRRAETDTSR